MTIEEAKQKSPAEINRIIAEALGWKWDLQGFTWAEVPDYFHDLNACQSVWNELKPYLRQRWINKLQWEGSAKTESDFFSVPAHIRAIALAMVLSERKPK